MQVKISGGDFSYIGHRVKPMNIRHPSIEPDKTISFGLKTGKQLFSSAVHREKKIKTTSFYSYKKFA